ncbi:unnamed protein product [Pleuronectes platessa]|uniref:Uncharacterized protein n=1 Tax=Pleuronectes platessa TaxID=8262 RepID=A0A9N7UYU7_PLEPL|nr:unnamed protein product [Pleuronectes platessa]
MDREGEGVPWSRTSVSKSTGITIPPAKQSRRLRGEETETRTDQPSRHCSSPTPGLLQTRWIPSEGELHLIV